jgi:hypothetical protein
MAAPRKKRQSERTSSRTIKWLLIGVGLCYVVGLFTVLVRFGRPEILSGILNGISALPRLWDDDDLSLDRDTGADTDSEPSIGAERRRPIEKKERYLREEPVNDNVPASALLDMLEDKSAPRSPPPSEPVPPAAVPKGMSIGDGVRSVKCWDSKGFEHDGESCDILGDFQKQVVSRLYIADTCRKEILGPLHTGVLSMAMEVDFVTNAVSVWEGSGSTLRQSQKVADCFAETLKNITPDRSMHRQSRYRLQLDITFGRERRLVTQVASVDTTAREEMKKALSNAKTVKVVKTRVRLRKAPVDGEIVGFVSTPAAVSLIEQKGDWCLVKTKRGNIGWMVCWALAL